MLCFTRPINKFCCHQPRYFWVMYNELHVSDFRSNHKYILMYKVVPITMKGTMNDPRCLVFEY